MDPESKYRPQLLAEAAATFMRGLGYRESEVATVDIILRELLHACDDSAEDTADDRFDDGQSIGALRYVRTRNRLKDLQEKGRLGKASVDKSSGAVLSPYGSTFSFWSAAGDTEHPTLQLNSHSKQRAVMDGQLYIDGLAPAAEADAPEPPRQLAILYDADKDGLREARVGVLVAATAWGSEILAFDRDGNVADFGSSTEDDVVSYHEQQEAELPPMPLKSDEEDEEPAP